MKKFIKENIKPLIFMIILIIVVNVELPYYIEAPGGTINLTERIDENYNKKNGSLNMLYVTEYKGNIVTVLLSKIIKTWDLYEISNQQVSDEDAKDIYIRNKVMLENSIQNATLVAYKEATADALSRADIIEKDVMLPRTLRFPYEKMNEVMRILKEINAKILSQDWADNQCIIYCEIQKRYADRI